MKKLLCILLTALLLVSTIVVYAETTSEDDETVSTQTVEETTEEKLERMLPVLDSFALNMGVDGEVVYDSEDAQFVWDQLYLMINNWSDEALEGAETVTVTAEDLIEDMTAAFYDLIVLPELPEEMDTAITYDETADAYTFVISDGDISYIVIEQYATDEEGYLLVGFGLYSEETSERLGGFLATLVVPFESLTFDETDAEEDEYPYNVTGVQLESDTDFDGLDVTECEIRYITLDEEDETTTDSYVELSYGDTGSAVAALQARLNELGYNCGEVDGIFGSKTRRAVRYFQDAIGYTQDGVASVELQEILFSSDAPEYEEYVTLQYGSTGIRVESLQSRLRKLGYLADPVDGDFGTRTEAAVKLFQKQAGLTVDGIAGTKTLKALYSCSASKCSSFITLYKGDTGSRVIEMQEQLAKLGFLSSKYVSGTYDSHTVSAVKAFISAVGESGNGKTASASLIKQMFSYVAATATATAEATATPTPTPEATEETEDTEDTEATATPEATEETEDTEDTEDTEPTVTPAATEETEDTDDTEDTTEATATPEATEEATEEPTAEATEEATEEPTATPTAEPTATPTAEPTATTSTSTSVLTDDQLTEVLEALAEVYGEGSESTLISALQEDLGVDVTGVYDEDTYNAVASIQSSYGLSGTTGVVDSSVLSYL